MRRCVSTTDELLFVISAAQARRRRGPSTCCRRGWRPVRLCGDEQIALMLDQLRRRRALIRPGRCLRQEPLAGERLENGCRMLGPQVKHAGHLRNTHGEPGHLQELVTKTKRIQIGGIGGDDHRHTPQCGFPAICLEGGKGYHT